MLDMNLVDFHSITDSEYVAKFASENANTDVDPTLKCCIKNCQNADEKQNFVGFRWRSEFPGFDLPDKTQEPELRKRWINFIRKTNLCAKIFERENFGDERDDKKSVQMKRMDNSNLVTENLIVCWMHFKQEDFTFIHIQNVLQLNLKGESYPTIENIQSEPKFSQNLNKQDVMKNKTGNITVKVENDDMCPKTPKYETNKYKNEYKDIKIISKNAHESVPNVLLDEKDGTIMVSDLKMNGQNQDSFQCPKCDRSYVTMPGLTKHWNLQHELKNDTNEIEVVYEPNFLLPAVTQKSKKKWPSDNRQHDTQDLKQIFQSLKQEACRPGRPSKHRDFVKYKEYKKDFNDVQLYRNWKDKHKQCFFCPQQFIMVTDFVLHVETEHNDKDLYTLAHSMLSMELKDLNWFRNDTRNKVEENKLLKPQRDVLKKNMLKPCEFCPQTFDKYGSLSTHYKTCHDDKDFMSLIKDPGMLIYVNLHKLLPAEMVICEFCAKEVLKRRYRQHINMFHHKDGPRMKKCEHCNIMVKRNSYNSHKNKHLAILRNYVCPECGKHFSNPESYRSHISIHGENRKKYECQECEKSYYNRGEFKRHIRKVHLNEQVDKACTLCGLVTRSLREHMLCHQTQMKYSCSLCGQKAKRRDTITQHMNGKMSKCANAEVLVDESVKYWREGVHGVKLPSEEEMKEELSTFQPLHPTSEKRLSRFLNPQKSDVIMMGPSK